jgi:hypothetical protein
MTIVSVLIDRIGDGWPELGEIKYGSGRDLSGWLGATLSDGPSRAFLSFDGFDKAEATEDDPATWNRIYKLYIRQFNGGTLDEDPAEQILALVTYLLTGKRNIIPIGSKAYELIISNGAAMPPNDFNYDAFELPIIVTPL